MREAVITIPKNDNSGHDLSHVLGHACDQLAAAFGGCTITEARGMWRDTNGKLYDEPMWRCIVACNSQKRNNRILRAIACEVGKLGRQEAVYLRYPNGNVEIVGKEQYQ